MSFTVESLVKEFNEKSKDVKKSTELVPYEKNLNEKTYYDILEINKFATEKEIKKAYKKLAMKYHPDKNPSSKEYFLLVMKAYNILIDSEKRKNYDETILQNKSNPKPKKNLRSKVNKKSSQPNNEMKILNNIYKLFMPANILDDLSIFDLTTNDFFGFEKTFKDYEKFMFDMTKTIKKNYMFEETYKNSNGKIKIKRRLNVSD